MNLGILADGISNDIPIRMLQIYKRRLQPLVLIGHLCHVPECTAIHVVHVRIRFQGLENCGSRGGTRCKGKCMCSPSSRGSEGGIEGISIGVGRARVFVTLL
jgi:hypothetical protein